MDNLKKLYEEYLKQGLISEQTSFDQFSSADASIKDNLYNLGVENKIISDSTGLEMFKSAWGTEDIEEAKIEDSASVDPTVESQQSMGSSSGNGSSESKETKPPRYLKFKDGQVVYEDEYLEKFAGTENYPSSFDDYAKLFNTTPLTFDAPEITIEATKSEELLLDLKDAWKKRKYNKISKTFDPSYNDVLTELDEEEAVEMFKGIYEGSGIEFEQANSMYDVDKKKELEAGVFGTDAVKMKILDKKTGEYVYSKPIELQKGGELAEINDATINDFIESNKENINIPSWVRNQNKKQLQLEKWQEENLNPQLNQKEAELKQQFLDNENLFEETVKREETFGLYGLPTVKVTKTIPYEKEIKKQASLLSKKYPNKPQEEIEELAKKNVRNDLYESARVDFIYTQNEKYLSQSSDAQKSQGLLYSSLLAKTNKDAKKFNESSKKTQIAEQSFYESKTDLNNVISYYNVPEEGRESEIKNIYSKYKVETVDASSTTLDEEFNKKYGINKGTEVSTNLYNIINKVNESADSSRNVMASEAEKMDTAIDKMGDTSTAADAASKNYNLLEKYAMNTALGFQDIAVGTAFLAGNILTAGQSETLRKSGANYVEYTNKLRNSFVRDVSFDNAFSSAENTGKFIAQEVSNQIPILVSLAATGGAAGYVIGASSAGQQMMDMQYEIATGSADYSQAEVWLKSAGFGIAEGVFSQLTTVKALRRAKSRFTSYGKEQIVNNSTKEFFKSKSPQLIYEPLSEALGEALTTGTQNLILGKPFTENMDHSGFSGFGFGLVFAGLPFMKGAYNSRFSTYDQLSEVRKTQKELTDLQKRFETSQSPVNSNSNKAIIDLINKKREKINDIVERQEGLINNNLTSNGAKSIIELNKIQAGLQNKFKEVSQDNSLDENTKDQILSNLKNEFDRIVKAKNKALSSGILEANETEWESFKALNKNKAQQYLTEAEAILKSERDGRSVEPSAVNRKAYDLYYGDIVREENAKIGKSKIFDKFTSYETVEGAISALQLRDDIPAETKQKIIDGLKKGNDGYADPVTKEQVAVVENQVKNQKRYTKVHEVGHEVFWKLLGRDNNSKAMRGVANQLLLTMKKVDNKLYNKFIKDGIDDDNGNIVPAEVVSRFLEYVSEGKITNVEKAKGIAGLFGVMVQKQFAKDYNFDFKGKNDIFNFVVGVGNKIKSGELTLPEIKQAKEAEIVSKAESLAPEGDSIEAKPTISFSKAVDQIQAQIEELEDKYDNDEIDYYDYENRLDILEAKLEEAKKVPAKPKKEVKAKEVNIEKTVKESTDKVFKEPEVSDKNKQIAKNNEDIANELVDLGVNSVEEIKDEATKKAIIDKLGRNNLGAVTNLAKKAAAAGKDLAIDENLKVGYDEFFSGFSEELSSLIRTYKVEVDGKKVPFGAYMNRNLSLRYGQILDKALKGRVKGSQSLDVQAGEKGFAGSIVADTARDFDVATRADQGLPAGELIDVTTFEKVKNKEPKIRESIDVSDKDIAGLTYKKIQEDYSGETGATILDLWDKNEKPEEGQSKNKFQKLAERIEGTRTLNYGKDTGGEAEVRAMQGLFRNYNDAVKFIKTIPEFNVAPFETTIDEQGRSIDLTEDARGYSIGISNKLLKKFYEPYIDPKSKSKDKAVSSTAITSPSGRGKGKTSQVAKVYRLKPEYRGRISRQTVKDLQKTIGITEAGEAFIPMKGANRTEFGTALQGLTKMYATNVANTIVRKQIVEKGLTSETKPLEKVLADIGGGKSSVMFSKANNAFEALIGIKSEADFNDPVKVDKIKKDIFKVFDSFTEKDFIKYILPTASKGYDFGFITTEDGSVKFVAKNNRNVVFKGRKDFFKAYNDYRKSNKLKPLVYKENARKIKLSNGEVFILSVLKEQSPKGITSGKFNKELADRVETAIDQREGLRKIVLKLKEYFDKNPNDAFTIPMIMAMLNSNTNGLVRTAAIPKWVMIQEGLLDADYVYEHTQTASDTVVELIRAIKESKNNNDLNNRFDKVMEFFDVAIIPKKLDSKVNKKYRYNGPRRSGKKSDYNSEIVYPSIGSMPVRYEESDIVLEQLYFDENQSSVVFSKGRLSTEFNKILENKTGIKADDTVSDVKAKMIANNRRKVNFFIPPSAEDFVGLLYATLGKGKVGDKQIKFYDRTLLRPYARAMQAIARDRLDLGRAFKNIRKEFKATPKDLKKKVPGSLFNKEQAVRIYIWDSIGKEVPGLNVEEVNELANYVADNKELKGFAEQVMRLNPGSKYLSPKEGWETGTITTDLLETLNTSRRAKHLGRWQQNVDEIFSKENLNKLEAAYGTKYRKAMENMLTRMKTGRNRTYGTDTQTSKWLDWVNGSVGTIMFFNTRSAVLQTLSSANFIDFKDNNIFAAGKAFANQQQYWSDFAKLMNSDYLLERRDSLKINVNEADIADAARQKGARGAINYLLKLGFTPTKFADSFAIASGGATFYRNKINALIKKGMDPVAAEKAAMREFIETAEESQQSSRPDKISQEQAGPLGRVILAFANTPAQYARIIKKAASDLKNGRGDAKTNISKIVYYGFAQNLMFNALQQAVFAIAFGDEEDEDLLKDKKLNTINGMLDGIIRGTGIAGSVFTVAKNAGIKIYKEANKKRPNYEKIVDEALKISPPISSKISKLKSAGRTISWDMKEIKSKGLDITNPAIGAGAKVASATTNVPFDRVIRKIENLKAASDSNIDTYQRLALILGWGKWELGIEDEKWEDPNKKPKQKGRRIIQRKVVIRKPVTRK